MNVVIRSRAGRAVVTVAALAISGCGDQPSPSAAEPPLPVLVQTVEHVARLEQRVFTAAVRARVESDLGFRVPGKVVQRLVDVGDSVRAGQPLARLDGSDYALGVWAATDQIRAATAEAEQAASEAARLGRLLADGSVGAADHERQKARADAAAARLDQASRNLDIARNRTAYATLTAPYAGVVTAIRTEVGQVVAEGQQVLSLAREGEREIVADIPETLVGRLARMQATATLWHGHAQPLDLRLREVSPAASGVAGTFRVRYAIAGSPGLKAASLPLGATARLHLSADGSPGVVLPVSALVKSGGAEGVWIVAAGRLVLRPVHVQVFEADSVRVSGLERGDRVVTAGAQKLDAAMKVTAIERGRGGT